MTVIQFGTASDLTKYVNDNTIAQGVLVTIVEIDRRWYLFHY